MCLLIETRQLLYSSFFILFYLFSLYSLCMKRYMNLTSSLRTGIILKAIIYPNNNIIMNYYPNALGISKCAIAGCWPEGLTETRLREVKKGKNYEHVSPSIL